MVSLHAKSTHGLRHTSEQGMFRTFRIAAADPFLSAVAAISFGLVGTAFSQSTLTVVRQDGHNTAVVAYQPTGGVCQGIVIVSPGAGGSESGYAYLGKGLQSLGYLVLVVGHQESGKAALRREVRKNGFQAGLEELTTDPAAYRARFMDIAAANNWAQPLCGQTKSVLTGHSMGAATAMMVAGARNHLGLTGGDTFDAYVVLSPQGAGSVFTADAWSGIKKPVLSITGTRDKALGGGNWDTRTEPFFNMPPGCKWLGVIKGASHMNFAGRGLSGNTESLTIKTISAFLQAIHGPECSAPRFHGDMEIQSK